MLWYFSFIIYIIHLSQRRLLQWYFFRTLAFVKILCKIEVDLYVIYKETVDDYEIVKNYEDGSTKYVNE